MPQHYAALVGLEDSLKQPRLQYFLVTRRGAHESGPGIAGLLLPNRATRQPWRRLALFRLMYLACRDCPEVVSLPPVGFRQAADKMQGHLGPAGCELAG